jgi:hypothetical protein
MVQNISQAPHFKIFSITDIQSFKHQSQPLFFNVNITSHYTLHVSAHMQAIIRRCKQKMIAKNDWMWFTRNRMQKQRIKQYYWDYNFLCSFGYTQYFGETLISLPSSGSKRQPYKTSRSRHQIQFTIKPWWWKLSVRLFLNNSITTQNTTLFIVPWEPLIQLTSINLQKRRPTLIKLIVHLHCLFSSACIFFFSRSWGVSFGCDWNVNSNITTENKTWVI